MQACNLIRNSIPARVPSKSRLKNIWFGTGVKRREEGIYRKEPQKQIVYKEIGEAPFSVAKAGPGKQYPVYVDYKRGGNQVVTILRKVSGDMEACSRDLQAVCGMKEVEVRPGKLVVKGNHTHNVVTWLRSIGV